MSFAHPQILWLLLVLPPALFAFFWWSRRKREALTQQFIQARLLPGLMLGVSPTRQKIRGSCVIAAVVCLLLALARPQWGFTWQEVKQRGVDIVLAIDTSKSMLARDIAPNRLARAKLAALDLMQLAKADRLGVVAFAGSAFLQCPLTIDDTAFRQAVESLDVNTIPAGGTALSEAIDTALTAFKEGDNHKVMVLMTDGEDHDSGAEEAAKKAASAGMRIYTIGIGTAEGELLRVQDAKGQEDYIRDEQGNVVKSHLNEGLLQEIATTGGGFYLRLSGAKTMDTLYGAPHGLASLPQSEHQEKLIKQYQEQFHWPLGLAIVLLIIEILVPERKVPRPTGNGGSGETKRASSVNSPPQRAVAESALAPALVAALLLLVPTLALASPSSALREYKEGQYDQALRDYKQSLERKPDDPRLHFNAGAAAYRNGKFSEATNQFSAALSTPDLKLQESAYYNRGNSLYRLGENSADSNLRSEAWEKALKDYELSLKLNTQDPDAKFNRDFVKKQLEELKKQQQQQKQSQQDNQQNKDQQQQQQQQQQNQKQDQDKKQDQDQQQQQQAQQNQSQQKQDSSKLNQSQQAQQKQQDQQQQQAAKQAQEQQQQQKQQQSASQDKQNQGEKEREAAAYAANQMTPEQAKQLLDAQKGEEMMLQQKPDAKPLDRSKPIKDW